MGKKFKFLILFLILFLFSGCNIIEFQLDNPLDINVTNKNIDVNVQDYTGETQDLKLIKYLGNFTLSQNLEVDQIYMQVQPGHNLVAGNTINMFCEGRLSQNNIENVNVNNITLAMQSDVNCQAGTMIKRGTAKANTLGSLLTPEEFCVDLTGYNNFSIDITRMMVFIQDNTCPFDSSKFGGLPQLSHPVVYRYYDSFTKNLFPASTLGAYGLRAFDLNDDEKAPAGFCAVYIRKSFNGADKMGAVIRLRGDNNDKFCMLNYVDLTGLTDFQNVAQGHRVTE